MRLQAPERMMRLQDLDGAKAKRKILKPLLEKRRRDRMNQSLSRLRTLLLSPQGASERRVEKAEILEHTVVFLRGPSSGAPEQIPHTFQDGFSACLHRATHFLEAEGKVPWLAPSLDAALSTLALDHGSVSVRWRKSPKTLLRELTQKRALAAAKSSSVQAPNGSPRPRAQTAHKGLNKRPSEGPHSGPQNPGPQSLWRPWP